MTQKDQPNQQHAPALTANSGAAGAGGPCCRRLAQLQGFSTVPQIHISVFTILQQEIDRQHREIGALREEIRALVHELRRDFETHTGFVRRAGTAGSAGSARQPGRSRSVVIPNPNRRG